MNSDEKYQAEMAAWQARMGLPADFFDHDPVFQRMLAEDLKDTGTGYCFNCGDEFVIRDMVLVDDCLLQCDEDQDEDGYIASTNRVRRCVKCHKEEQEGDE